MAEFVKKTVMGYKTAEHGQFDSDCSHVILTKSEYEKIINEKELLIRKIDNIKISTENQVKQIQDEMSGNFYQILVEKNEEIKKVKQQIQEVYEKIEYLNGLNKNLLRIARERANADRKLKPKKEHTGYVVVTSSEKPYHYRTEYGERKTVMLWETILQSPYSVDFTEEQARNLTEDLIRNTDGKPCLIGELGIKAIFEGDIETFIKKSPDWNPSKKEKNIMFKSRLRANYRTGYWEVFLNHTKPLGIVPINMRAR